MYRFDVTKGVLLKGSEVIPQDDRDPRYLEYVDFLRDGGSVESFESPLTEDNSEKILEEARAFGKALMNNFMSQALKSGANEMGLAGSLLAYFAPVVLALEIGSLHAALEYVEVMLQSPEETRPAYPYTSDVALGAIRGALKGEILAK